MRNSAHAAPAGAASGAAGPAAAGSSIQRFRAIYAGALEVVVSALIVILAIEVTLGVVFRTFGHALVWYDEVASVLLAWITFYGSALASARRAHISCPELINMLPVRLNRAVNILAQLLVITFFGILGWIGASILPIIAGDSLVTMPQVSMAIVQSVIPVSAVLILIAEILHLADLITGKAVPAGSH